MHPPMETRLKSNGYNRNTCVTLQGRAYYGTVVSLPLAQTGEGISECELIQWFVKEVDSVVAFGRLCEVQSDKATIEITSRFEGRDIFGRHGGEGGGTCADCAAAISRSRSSNDKCSDNCRA
ncbi:hypothetical protein CEUSTIGMA_g5268.t1 [Chlamydomonas eustigma]|uniref:Lipoamide acyltransferase component of branched-chain alpha-keto acid dehydrogenase complex, mitochondrial n=1 Tax=Chlamydomonas eustigma TaxID=1157962 RepID=A0A250X425_9CHLO|nr:hypothetical protein CEUSTIGMA_g5268.t1 [Chlamydomonas eustigma]|eukprot:GAX77825.1 hypothetical protein CEUSTIGMA_g5268.t1 [Chlamydomonas eustigma]